MTMLARQPNSIFVGQNVRYGAGIAMHKHLAGVPEAQRIEFPVAEDLQLGFCTGLALQGFLPISIYPRFDFLLLAMSQLVLHLDKLNEMSRGQFNPKVIIRTRVGQRAPLDAGPQHSGRYTDSLRLMLDNVDVREIQLAEQIIPTYTEAIESKRSVVVVENV